MGDPITLIAGGNACMRWKIFALVIFMMAVAAHYVRPAEPHRDPGLERSLSSVQQGFQKTNSCLDIQTQLSMI